MKKLYSMLDLCLESVFLRATRVNGILMTYYVTYS
jgi:hypothetical protein